MQLYAVDPSFGTSQHDSCPPCSELPPTLSTLKPHDASDTLAPITSSASVWQPKLPAVSEHPTQPHTESGQQHDTQPPHPHQLDHLVASHPQPRDLLSHPLTSGHLQRPSANTSPFDTSLSAQVSQHALQGGHYTPAQEAGASGSIQQPGFRDAAAQTQMQMQQQHLNTLEREPLSGATDSGGYAHDHRLSRRTASTTVGKQQSIWIIVVSTASTSSWQAQDRDLNNNAVLRMIPILDVLLPNMAFFLLIPAILLKCPQSAPTNSAPHHTTPPPPPPFPPPPEAHDPIWQLRFKLVAHCLSCFEHISSIDHVGIAWE